MDLTRLAEITENQRKDQLALDRHEDVLAVNAKTADSVLSSTEALINYLEGHVTKAEVINQLESISTPDVKYVVEALQVLDATLRDRPLTDLSAITELMASLVEEAKAIPKQLPTIPDAPEQVDYSAQFQALTTAIQAVEQVVKEQELIAEAPIVNVPETNVNVEAPNLVPLQTSIKAVVTAVKAITIPKYETDNKEVEKLLKKSNKLLNDLLDKPTGGGGGGGSSWPAVGTDGNAQPLVLNASGGLVVADPYATYLVQYAPISISTIGDNTIVPAVAGKSLVVLSAKVTAAGTVNVKWRSGITDLEGANPLVASSGYVLPAGTPGSGAYFPTAIAEPLVLNLSAAVQVSGHISYYEQ